MEGGCGSFWYTREVLQNPEYPTNASRALYILIWTRMETAREGYRNGLATLKDASSNTAPPRFFCKPQSGVPSFESLRSEVDQLAFLRETKDPICRPMSQCLLAFDFPERNRIIH